MGLRRIELRDVPGCPGYKVSSNGQVWSYRWNRWKRLKPSRTHSNGYQVFKLAAGYGRRPPTRTFYLHRLMLEVFVGPCPDGLECCHADDDPSNNDISNLRWDTHSSNLVDSYRNGHNLPQPGSMNGNAKLHETDIPELRRLKGLGYSYRRLAKMYGTSHVTIRFAVIGRSWRHCRETER